MILVFLQLADCDCHGQRVSGVVVLRKRRKIKDFSHHFCHRRFIRTAIASYCHLYFVWGYFKNGNGTVGELKYNHAARLRHRQRSFFIFRKVEFFYAGAVRLVFF